MDEASNKHYHIIEIILIHYFWPILIAIASFFIMFFPTMNKVPMIEGKQVSIINTSIPPSLFVHLTDLHLSPSWKLHLNRTKEAISFIGQNIRPTAIIISGDLTDGTEKPTKYTRHQQFKSNWEKYSELVKSITHIPIIATAGNHDEATVESITHRHHYYISTLNSSQISEYRVQRHLFDTNHGRIKIVSFNPFRFPAPPIPFGLFISPPPFLLDTLEKELIKTHNSDYTILTSHFPYQCFYNSKSTEKRTILDILTHSGSQIAAYLVGHFHMPNFYASHLNSTVQIIGSTTAISGNIGVLSIDGSIMSYNIVDPSSKVPFIVTNPPKIRLFNPNTGFNNGSFRVRVIVFSTKIQHINATIDKHACGELKVDLIMNNSIVYSLPLNLSNGIHSLQLSGAISHKQDFFIGKEVMKSSEAGISFYLRFHSLLVVFIIVLVFMVTFFIFPPILSRFYDKSLQNFSLWLMKSTFDDLFSASTVLKCVFKGPLFMIWTYGKTPKKARVVLFITLCSTVFLPLYTVKYEDESMIVMMWGCLTKTGPQFCVMSLMMASAFISMYIIPFLYLFGMSSTFYDNTCFHQIEYSILNSVPLLAIFGTFMLAYIGGGWKSVYSSSFSIMILLSFIALSVFLRKTLPYSGE